MPAKVAMEYDPGSSAPPPAPGLTPDAWPAVLGDAAAPAGDGTPNAEGEGEGEDDGKG